MSQVRPFPVDTRLTGIALAYQNKNLIAESVLPRVQVGSTSFKWLFFPTAERMTIPNTLVGRKGRPNEVEFSAIEQAGLVYDYGLDDVIPNDDVATAPAGFDPMGVATQGLTDLIALDREVRVARLVFNPDTYSAGNKVQNTAGDYWDEDTSNPQIQIMDILETPLVRPNVAVFSQRVYDRLRIHPKIVAAVFGNGGNAATGGVVSRQQLAALFELDRIEVGGSYVNTAKPGQAATIVRTWSNDAAFLHVNPLANTRSPQMTFGYTAQWGSRVAGQMAEPQTGLRGSIRVRVGETVNEIIAAPDAGYFVEDAITP